MEIIGTEKDRKNQRQDTDDPTFIIVSEGATRGTIADISISGVRFFTDKNLKIKSIVDININYDPVNFLQKAHIIWSKKAANGMFEYGAEFINVRPEHAVLLEGYIQAQKAK